MMGDEQPEQLSDAQKSWKAYAAWKAAERKRFEEQVAMLERMYALPARTP
jgi:hypothetical protein